MICTENMVILGYIITKPDDKYINSIEEEGIEHTIYRKPQPSLTPYFEFQYSRGRGVPALLPACRHMLGFPAQFVSYLGISRLSVGSYRNI